jgi:hypothetical protein
MTTSLKSFLPVLSRILAEPADALLQTPTSACARGATGIGTRPWKRQRRPGDTRIGSYALDRRACESEPFAGRTRGALDRECPSRLSEVSMPTDRGNNVWRGLGQGPIGRVDIEACSKRERSTKCKAWVG